MHYAWLFLVYIADVFSNFINCQRMHLPVLSFDSANHIQFISLTLTATCCV